jgi:ZIP family zinc transporter
MLEWFIYLGPVAQALIATLFTWFVTALGASAVFFFKSIDRTLLDGMLGFAAGVMIAASFWSLLAPAIERAESGPFAPWVPAVVGFLLGGGFLWVIDRTLPHLHLGFPTDEAEGIKTIWQRSVLLVLAITLHNIPEGLAVGVAFGAVAAGLETADLAGATALALGVPLRRENMSKFRAFWYGQLSGIVEPIAGVMGAAAVLLIRPLLPFALAFAAGAMIYVVVEELIPESQIDKKTDVATFGAMMGFAIMMMLDVALG